jgi:Cft2 family RNA processing exonuclease
VSGRGGGGYHCGDEMADPLFPFLEIRPEGLYAPAFAASLDPREPAQRAILSHAHSDHAVPGHAEVWATPETLALYRRRHPEWNGIARTLRQGETAESGAFRLSLFPAGHVLGSAQVFFEEGGRSLLYTGDFKRRDSATALAARTPAANVLLTETTFGLPVFRFPAREELAERLVASCRGALEEGKTPVLLAYALGKSQEAAAILDAAGIPTVLHGAAWKLLPDYAEAGFHFPLARAYAEGPPGSGEALIVPPSCARTPVILKIRKRRVIYLSGWAMRSASRADFDADLLLPMSDHADFDELLAHVDEVRPRTVLTMHGYARDFARILSGRGIEAVPLAEIGERRPEDA